MNALCWLVDTKYDRLDAPQKVLPDIVLMAQLDYEGYPVSNSQVSIEARLVDLLGESRRGLTLQYTKHVCSRHT